MTIFINNGLYELLAGLPRGFTFGSGSYKLNAIDRYCNKVTQKMPYTLSGQTTRITVDRTILLLSQEMTSIALWTPIASIVFASSLLPIIPTQTPCPKDIGSRSSNLISGGNNSNLLPNLSGFPIAVDTDSQYRPMVEYTPGAEYRSIDMNSTTNLS